MRVLHLGGNGNLGSRVIPALLAHSHTVIAYIRSPEKLHKILSEELINRITIIPGDAFSSIAIADTLRNHSCDAVINTAGTREPPGHEQTLGKIVASITSAAIEVGRERGKPLRAWIVGGMGSLQYPGTDRQIQDYMPAELTEHHRGTEIVMSGIPTNVLEWSLLCVAMMRAESEDIKVLDKPRGHQLLMKARIPPGPEEPWKDNLPFGGAYLDLGRVIREYTTRYEDVADLLADEIGKKNFVGDFVGFKSPPETERKNA